MNARSSGPILPLADMPYGIWTCQDGSEVLFNRSYRPMWQRTPGGPAMRIGPCQRVRYIRQAWFYDDDTPDGTRRERGLEVLRQWGVIEGERA